MFKVLQSKVKKNNIKRIQIFLLKKINNKKYILLQLQLILHALILTLLEIVQLFYLLFL